MIRTTVSLVLLVMVHVGQMLAASWSASAEVRYGEPQSLVWCINQASAGDTILLLPGTHWGPISLSGQLLLRCDTPGDAAIVAHMQPLSISNYSGRIENVTVLSYLTRGPEWLVNITDSDVEMDSVNFCGSTLAGTTLTLVGDCNVSLWACDLSHCPREIIKLVNCTNDVVTTNCQWPSESLTGLEILIWDKDDDPMLGNVIY